MKIKSLYCGGGFIDSQLLWIIPIIDSYCKKNNFNTIIFEKKLNDKIIKSALISNILQNYNVFFSKDNLSFFRILSLIFYFIKNICVILYYSIITNRKILLNKDLTWKKAQILHSIWDTSFFYLGDENLHPSFFHKFKATLRVFYNINIAYWLVNYKNVHAAFMGHSVYTSRAMIAIFREFKIKIITHANYVLNIIPNIYDNSPNIINKKILFRLDKSKLWEKSQYYWKRRIKGFSNYEDAKIAYQSSVKIKNKELNYNNLVMMHIFRDSPFNIIDRNRIFADYISWIENTLRAIKDSEENWIIRPHPNFKRWGENSYKTYKKIFYKTFNKYKLKNVRYINDNISNIELFKKAKRIVTYSGTSHLEAACFGKRPIIISKCTLSDIDKKFVLKPKNYKEYYKLILINSNSEIFKLNEEKIRYARLILFIKENITTLRMDLKGSSIYRADKKSIRDYEFSNIYKNLGSKLNFLLHLGNLLGTKIESSISEKYLKYYNFSKRRL